MLKNENIICISWLVWDSIPLVMHHMMTRLAKNNRVLFVDPPYPLSAILMDPRRISYLRETIRRWRGGIKKVSDSLCVYYPPPLLINYGRLLKVNDLLNQRIMAKLIKKTALLMNIKSPILWIFHPYMILPDGTLNEKLICYDCNDDVAGLLSRFKYQRKNLLKLEEELVKKADIVFSTSQGIYESKKRLNNNTYYLPSGADIDMFSKALLESGRLPEDIKNILGPIIGFFGGISNRKMNWEWIKVAALKHPEWSFVFIGPVCDPLPSEINKTSNIYFLGKKPMEELPNYLRAFRVCLIPYKESDFMNNCFPTKTFEYLAAGKPVVSTDIPALREFQPLVKLCRSIEEFISAIDAALKEGPDIELQQRRIALASDNTWESRFEKASRLIEDCLQKRIVKK